MTAENAAPPHVNGQLYAHITVAATALMIAAASSANMQTVANEGLRDSPV